MRSLSEWASASCFSTDGVRELVGARWGMPSSVFVLTKKKTDLRVINIRNIASPHWRHWLGVESRRVVPFTSLSTNDHFAFLTSDPNVIVAPIHPKAMPAILTTAEDVETWLRADPRHKFTPTGVMVRKIWIAV
jgi:putative SOS response-associated peptidase YedK